MNSYAWKNIKCLQAPSFPFPLMLVQYSMMQNDPAFAARPIWVQILLLPNFVNTCKLFNLFQWPHLKAENIILHKALWVSALGFLNIGAIESLGWVILCCGGYPMPCKCSAPSLTPTHYMLVAPVPQVSQLAMSPDMARFPWEKRVQGINHTWLRTNLYVIMCVICLEYLCH